MSQTDFAAREAALRARLDAPEPTTWRPDNAEENHPRLLIGELVSVSSGTTVWGQRQIAILRDSEGALWNVWLLHKVLIDEFLEKQPRIGEMLALSYDGKVEPTGGGSGYEKYRVVVDRPNAAVAWRGADDTFAGVAVDQTQPAAAAPAAPVQETLPPAPVEPPVVQNDLCGTCGFANGLHATGCSNDIPF